MDNRARIVAALIPGVTLLLIVCVIGGCGPAKSTRGGTPTTSVEKPMTSSKIKAGADWVRITGEKEIFGGGGTQRITDVAVYRSGIVAVGRDSRKNSLAVWISEDAINWTRLGLDNFEGGQDITGDYWGGHGSGEPVIAAGPSMLVVATGLNIWVSQDGFKWRKLPKNEAAFGGEVKKRVFSLIPIGINDIIANGAGFIAVGGGGYWRSFDTGSRNAVVWLSRDGISWKRLPHDTAIFGGKGVQEIYTIASSDQGVIAAGKAIRPSSASDAALWASKDGTTWARVPHDDAVFGGKEWQTISDVASGPNGFVAVGSEWPDFGSDKHPVVWTSIVGRTWTRIPYNKAVFGDENSCSISRVIANNQGYIAIGQEERNHQSNIVAWSSKDGATWTRVALKGTGKYIDYKANGIVTFRSGLVIVGEEDKYGDINGAVWVSGNLVPDR